MFLRFLLLSLLSGVLSGCAEVFWMGSVSSNLQIPPNQYNYLASVSGHSKNAVFLGVFGNRKQADLIENAKKDLLSKVALRPNCILADWSYSVTNRHILFFSRVQNCQVRANLISLVPVPPDSFPILVKSSIDASQMGLEVGDKVLFTEGANRMEGQIVKLNGEEVTIIYFDAVENTNKKATRRRRELEKRKVK
jgi:hypothetical protein